ALLSQLSKLAVKQPVLMVFEDLHWVDPTSLQQLSLTVDQIPDQRILLLATARPEFAPPWPSHRHTSTISLSRLGRSEVTAVVASVSQASLVLWADRDEIVTGREGVALLVENGTKRVNEGARRMDLVFRYNFTGPRPPLAIPSTLQASLLARLDRLASVKD